MRSPRGGILSLVEGYILSLLALSLVEGSKET